MFRGSFKDLVPLLFNVRSFSAELGNELLTDVFDNFRISLRFQETSEVLKCGCR